MASRPVRGARIEIIFDDLFAGLLDVAPRAGRED